MVPAKIDISDGGDNARANRSVVNAAEPDNGDGVVSVSDCFSERGTDGDSIG